MKKTVLIFFSLVAIQISCTKEESPLDLDQVQSAIQEGTWRISYYWDTDKEETTHFEGYDFTFSSDGTLLAKKGMDEIQGTWSTQLDDRQQKLVLQFEAPPDFSDLSDDWHVVSITDMKISLEDISGGNGGTDYLDFEKN